MKTHLVLLIIAGASLGHHPVCAQPQSPAQITDVEIREAVERTAPAMIELRHQVHQHPELSNREFDTSKLVAERLRSLGLEVQTGIAQTGVLGILKGGRPGPVAAVRSELDALPITEENSLPFKSTTRSTYNGQDVGVAHVCGHDIHMAVILGVAGALTSMRERLPGTVMFIFQPAEEGEGGAHLMLKEGLFSKLKPDAVFGLHSIGTLDVGQIRYSLGPTNAVSTDFRIVFHGKRAHAAWPQEAIDPVVMAAEAVMELQTIRSRNLSPYDQGVLSVTMLHAGVLTSTIPDQATLEGTIRLFDDNLTKQVKQRVRDIVESIARGAGGSAEVEFSYYAPVLINDRRLVKRMLPAVERVVGATNVQEAPPLMAADDFSYFAELAPAFFFQLGTQKPGTTSGINHAPNFLADDSSILIGMQAMTEVLLEYLRTTPAR